MEAADTQEEADGVWVGGAWSRHVGCGVSLPSPPNVNVRFDGRGAHSYTSWATTVNPTTKVYPR